MTDWTQMECGALKNFLMTPGPLKSALERFLAQWQQDENAMCAGAMATVPRNHELAADHAAKAQLLGEFWATLEDQLNAVSNFVEAQSGANPEEQEVVNG